MNPTSTLPPPPTLRSAVPLPPPPTHISAAYTYTAPSPSSLEAWQNKPKRVEQWSRTVSPRPPARGADAHGSWGKGVGVGSAAWSGTGTTAPPETDGGTEPTTFRCGKGLGLRKEDRAGEVVREQRKLGSQASVGSRAPTGPVALQDTTKARGIAMPDHSPVPDPAASALSVTADQPRRLGSHTSGRMPVAALRSSLGNASSAETHHDIKQIRLAVPTKDHDRPAPVPFLALPKQAPFFPLSPATPGSHRTTSHTPGFPSAVPYDSALSARPPLRALGSDGSGLSARARRDAFVASALASPLDLLAEIQRDPPAQVDGRAQHKAEVEVIRKTRSTGSTIKRAETGEKVPAQAKNDVRKAKSGGAGPSKGRSVSEGVHVRSNVNLGRSQTMPAPKNQDRTPMLPPLPLKTQNPSSSILTAPSSSPATPSIPQPAKYPRHRHPAPMLRPALSRSGSSLNVLNVPDGGALGLHFGPAKQHVQARFEPEMYPLPPSGTTASAELSPVRNTHDQRQSEPSRSLGSAASRKAKMPIVVDIDPSLTDSSAAPGRFSTRPHQIAEPALQSSQNDRPAHPAIILHRSTPHDISPSPVASLSRHTHPVSADLHLSSPDQRSPDTDRISFEIPNGPRGRLRVSLAWFKDVRSSRRRRKEGLRFQWSDSGETSGRPPLPAKDHGWTTPIRQPSADLQHSHPLPRASPILRPPPEQYQTQQPIEHQYLDVPGGDRSRVRFSPVPLPVPAQSTYHPQTAPPFAVSNPYLPPPTRFPLTAFPHTLGNPAQPPTMYPQTQPNPWAKMSLPNLRPGIAAPSNTQAPPSPRRPPSIDLPSDASPPNLNRMLPLLQQPPVGPYPQPGTLLPLGYGARPDQFENGMGTQLSWPGRPSIWQKMGLFRQHDDGQQLGNGMAGWGKDGLINKWRRNVRTGPPNTVYYPDDQSQTYVDFPAARHKTPLWTFRMGTREGTVFGRRSRASQGNHPSGPLHPARTRLPMAKRRPTDQPVMNDKERRKAERRSQRKERRDRRDFASARPQVQQLQQRSGLYAKTELHPDDSITRAGIPIFQRRPLPDQPNGRDVRDERDGRDPRGRGRPTFMVKEWVRGVTLRDTGQTVIPAVGKDDGQAKTRWSSRVLEKRRKSTRQGEQGLEGDRNAGRGKGVTSLFLGLGKVAGG